MDFQKVRHRVKLRKWQTTLPRNGRPNQPEVGLTFSTETSGKLCSLWTRFDPLCQTRQIPARHFISKGSQQQPTIEVSRISVTKQRSVSSPTDARAMLHPEVDGATKVIQRTTYWISIPDSSLNYSINRTSCAFWIPALKLSKLLNISAGSSVFTTKFQTILKAAEFLYLIHVDQ